MLVLLLQQHAFAKRGRRGALALSLLFAKGAGSQLEVVRSSSYCCRGRDDSMLSFAN